MCKDTVTNDVQSKSKDLCNYSVSYYSTTHIHWNTLLYTGGQGVNTLYGIEMQVPSKTCQMRNEVVAVLPSPAHMRGSHGEQTVKLNEGLNTLGLTP